jgi:hypothetical protein
MAIGSWHLGTARVTIRGSNLVTGRMTIRGWYLVTGRMIVIRPYILAWNVADQRASPKWWLKVINCCYRRKPTLTDQKSYDLFSWQFAESQRGQRAREVHSSCSSSRRLTLRNSCFTYCWNRPYSMSQLYEMYQQPTKYTFKFMT